MGYLEFAPAVFLLGPLAGLLLISRPASRREWAWIIGAGAGVVLWLQPAGDLADQFVRAAGVFFTGAFVALTLWRPRPSLRQGALALAATLSALAVWCMVFGIRWQQLQAVVTDNIATALSTQARLAALWSQSRQTARLFDEMSANAGDLANLFVGMLTLAALAGVALAWRFYHRIATHPVGRAPARFRAFTFSDHVIWGVVAAVALMLLPAVARAESVGANLLLVLTVLYALRGAAIGRSLLADVPGVVALTLTVISFFLFPFVAGGLTLLGLADTWLDFRRRLAPSTGGGFNR